MDEVIYEKKADGMELSSRKIAEKARLPNDHYNRCQKSCSLEPYWISFVVDYNKFTINKLAMIMTL